jgi:phosphoglycerate dehydrogenase-like enzyme
VARILLAVQPGHYGVVIDPSTVEALSALAEVERMDDWWETTNGTGPPDATSAYAERVARSGAEVLVTCWGTPKLTLDGYETCTDLRYLCHLAGTVRGIVDRRCIEAGLVVSNWGNAISRTVAEGALMMTLAALRRVTSRQLLLHGRRGWRAEGARPQGLFGRSVGLVGLGAIAREFVRLLAPFGCRVEAYSPHDPDAVFEEMGLGRRGSLEGLFASNDVVSIHAGLTDETRHMVTADVLGVMKDGALLVNTARGAIVDTDALVAELGSGRIHAALDVYEEEPLPGDHPLRGLENCLLMPHEAGPTDDRKVDMGGLALRNIERYVAGERPEFVVTPERYDLST